MQILVIILTIAAKYIIIGLSFSIVYSTSKFFAISHGALLTLAAYLQYSFLNFFNLDFLISFILSISLIAFLQFLLYNVVYLNLNTKSSLLQLISSLGIYIIIQNLISIIWGDETKPLRLKETQIGNKIFDAYITDIQTAIILLAVIIVILSLIFFQYSDIGKQIRAVSSNEYFSEILGVNSTKVKIVAAIIGAVLACVAGILIGLDTYINPTMGFNLLLWGIIAMIIGGVGSVIGLIGGAVLLASAQYLGSYFLDAKWMDAIAYIILILFLIWRPLGFSGKRLKKIEI